MSDDTPHTRGTHEEQYSKAKKGAWIYTAACAFTGMAAAFGTPVSTPLAWIGAVGWLLMFAATCFMWSVFGAHMHIKHHHTVEQNSWDDMPCWVCDPKHTTEHQPNIDTRDSQ